MDCNNTYCLRRPLNMSFDYKYWVFFSQHNNNLYFAVFINAISTTTIAWCRSLSGRLQLKCDGTQWRTGGEVKGKLANGVGSQYSSHYLGTWCIQHYYRWLRTPRLPVADWTDDPADLNGLVRFAERRNLVSARVSLQFNWPLAHFKNNRQGKQNKHETRQLKYRNNNKNIERAKQKKRPRTP